MLVRQDSVSPERADISVETHLSMAGGKPYLYTVEAELESGGSVADRVTVKTGLRSFCVDPERGFMLNGTPYPLYGFNRHDDFKGVGSALLPHHYRRDMQLIEESGATMIRLAHYPHGNPIYHLADSCGIVLWSEIPLCGPGGYMFTGYVDNVADNARQTAREMVYQKFNHPSVCFWGIFNELLVDEADERLKPYDPPVPMAKDINRIFHQADPSRLTCFATCSGQSFYHDCADLIAWNKYFGWKDADLQAAKHFVTRRHALTDIKAFTNLKHATLYVNGRKIGRGRTDSICRTVWPEISLEKGENTIRVEGRHNGKTLSDQCRWVLE